MKALVSIIIPIYNRISLIEETLRSIQNQSYTNWECILVDDHSTDGTYSFLQGFVKLDSRFKLFSRPNFLLKGANACRNYGFNKSKGLYVKWYDSDDIMLEKHLETAVNTLESSSYNFVVVDSVNFNHNTGEILGRHYNWLRDDLKISALNFANYSNAWTTLDFVAIRDTLNITFDERLKSGQEYNFFVRFLIDYVKGQGHFIDEILSHRRIHRDSIGNRYSNLNAKSKLKERLDVEYLTLKAIEESKNKSIISFFLKTSIDLSYTLAKEHSSLRYIGGITRRVLLNLGFINAVSYFLSIILGLTLKKGHKFYKLAKKDL